MLKLFVADQCTKRNNKNSQPTCLDVFDKNLHALVPMVAGSFVQSCAEWLHRFVRRVGPGSVLGHFQLEMGTGLQKASILCILDTRQIDPHKTASIQKNDNT